MADTPSTGDISTAATTDDAVAAVAADDARRGLDRLVFFSDAVIAIAITLVVLPLVDVARDVPAGEGSRTTADFFADNGPALLAAGISFAVIASYWREHHRIFLHAARSNRLLILLNLLWLAGIAFLPLATVLKVDAPATDGLANLVYIGTIGATSALLRLEELVLARAGLFQPGFTPSAARLASRWTAVALTAVALVMSTAWPSLGLYPLLLLLLSAPIQWALRRRESAAA